MAAPEAHVRREPPPQPLSKPYIFQTAEHASTHGKRPSRRETDIGTAHEIITLGFEKVLWYTGFTCAWHSEVG